MTLTKKQRKEVWDKSDGVCWYCGCNLPGKGWHADHIEPIFRGWKERHEPERNRMSNIVPACSKCNLLKSTYSLEVFREEVELQVARGRKYSSNFRNAE